LRRVKVKDMQKKSVKRYIIISLVVMVSALFIYWKFFRQDRDAIRNIKTDTEPIHIAIAGPMTGSSASVGKAFRQGISLYVDVLNEKGGINGRQIILDPFDDENDSKKAKEAAEKIAFEEKNPALAVIGHHYSNCSTSAGEIYKKHKIPALTPASTNIEVTQGNPWYFRTCFNDRLQGRFLANYAKKVLGLDKVSIIMDSDTYGTYLTEVFEETAKGLGLEIGYKWKFDTNAADLDDRLKKIVRQFKSKNDAGALFLPVHGKEGVSILVKLKDIDVPNSASKVTILGPDAFTTEAFQQGFAEYPKEKQQPGYYTDGIFVTTPLLFDTTNEKGQKFIEAFQKKYHEKPGVHAAFAYDSVMMLIDAIKNSGIQGLKQTLPDDREKIRNYLAGINTTINAIEGVTGYNYFDKTNDSQKPIYMGFYRKRNIVSALIQFQSVTAQDASAIESAKNADWVQTFDGKDMYKTNVIYTGIEIKEISDLELLRMECIVDFFIWFRYQGSIDVRNIEFINVSSPIVLKDKYKDSSMSEQLAELLNKDKNVPPTGQPGRDKNVSPIIQQLDHEKNVSSPIELGTGKLIRERDLDQLKYKLYHVRGKFKTDFLPGQKAYNQHILGISFRHFGLDRNNLIYVKDVLGMGTPNEEVIAERMIEAQVLNSSSGWKINKVLFFQDVVRQSSKGDPDYLNVQQGTIEFSRFNAGIVISENKFNILTLIHREYMIYILILSSVVLLVIFLIGYTDRFKPYTKTIWTIQSIFALFLLLSCEVTITDWVAGKKDILIDPTVRTFQILWWWLPAMLFSRGVERFLWKPLEEKTGRVVPNVIRRFLLIITYTMVLLGIIAFVFDQKLTSILATSGLLAMIIGLAVQANIANIFSGIAINIERPFRIGDWVQIGTYPEGKIIDINWRTTKIQTRDDTVLSIPNSKASESSVENFSFPNAGYWQYFTLHVDAIHPPERVKKILLDATLSSKYVCKDPAPFTRFLGLTSGITKLSESWAANYLICIFVPDYGKKFAYNEEVWMNLWKHLRRANIRVVLPRQETHFFLEGVRRKSERLSKSLMTLQELEIFRPFSGEAKEYLSKKMRLHHYLPGETIVQQGDRGKSLFIVEEGVVGIWVKFDDNPETPMGLEVARMGAGNFFGEMALLTGEARTASIVSITETNLYEITKNDIAPFLEREPEITRLLSNILTERKMATESQKSQSQSQKIDKATLYDQMLGKIQSFFGFK